MEEILNKVHHADCIEFLKKIPDESIDMVLTDPPFMISKEMKITRGRNKMKFKGKDISLNMGEWDFFDSLADYFRFTKQWLDECVRVLKSGRILATWFDKDKINFVSWYLQRKYGFKTKGYFAMIYSNPVPQARKQKWCNGWMELGLWQKPGGKLVFNYWLGERPDYEIVPILSSFTKSDGKRCHPTQKPLKIVEIFVSYWTNEGEVVLDPFAGSGTVGVACKRLGRNFILIEKDERFVNIMKKRIEQESKQIIFKIEKRDLKTLGLF